MWRSRTTMNDRINTSSALTTIKLPIPHSANNSTSVKSKAQLQIPNSTTQPSEKPCQNCKNIYQSSPSISALAQQSFVMLVNLHASGQTDVQILDLIRWLTLSKSHTPKSLYHPSSASFVILVSLHASGQTDVQILDLIRWLASDEQSQVHGLSRRHILSAGNNQAPRLPTL